MKDKIKQSFVFTIKPFPLSIFKVRIIRIRYACVSIVVVYNLGVLEGMALQELDILKKENADLKEQLVLTSTNFYQTTDKSLYNEVSVEIIYT